MVGISKEAEAAIMQRHMTGRVMVNHFRRPSVSMVLMAGSPKMKLIAPEGRLVSIRATERGAERRRKRQTKSKTILHGLRSVCTAVAEESPYN